MGFSESIKLSVKKRADFTCCWCTDLRNKVEVHHIIPQADAGLSTEDNAAPLCSNCHTLYGSNPDLRKEIRIRRDHWYEICLKRLEFAWSPSLHIPLLDSYEITIPPDGHTILGTNVREDWPRLKFYNQEKKTETSPLQILMGFYPEISGGYMYPRALSVRVEVPFGLLFNLEICAESYWDVAGLMDTLRKKKDIWMLKAHPDDSSSVDPIYQLRDYFMLIRMNDGENRLIMRTYMRTEASIAFRARLTDEVLIAFADYLEDKGFTKKEIG